MVHPQRYTYNENSATETDQCCGVPGETLILKLTNTAHLNALKEVLN